jgi:cell division protein FtsL
VAKFKNPFHGITVEYTRSHPATKLVLIALILVCTAALITLRLTSVQLKREIQELRTEAAELEAQITDLNKKLEQLDSVEGVENIAEDELGLLDPDTIVLDPNP